MADITCACAHHDDGSVTKMLCPQHASQDPCLTMAQVTGRRRRGTIRSGVCTNCGWGGPRRERPGISFTRDQVEAWVGHELADAEVAELEEALPNSSFPECVEAVAHEALGIEDIG